MWDTLTITRVTRLIRNLGLVMGIPMLGGAGLYFHTIQVDSLREQINACATKADAVTASLNEQLKIKERENALLALLRCDDAETFIRSAKLVYQDMLNKAHADIAALETRQNAYLAALDDNSKIVQQLKEELSAAQESLFETLVERTAELEERKAELEEQKAKREAKQAELEDHLTHLLERKAELVAQKAELENDFGVFERAENFRKGALEDYLALLGDREAELEEQKTKLEKIPEILEKIQRLNGTYVTLEDTTTLFELMTELISLQCTVSPIVSLRVEDRDGVVPPLETCLRTSEEPAEGAKRVLKDLEYQRNTEAARRMLPAMWDVFGVDACDLPIIPKNTQDIVENEVFFQRLPEIASNEGDKIKNLLKGNHFNDSELHYFLEKIAKNIAVYMRAERKTFTQVTGSHGALNLQSDGQFQKSVEKMLLPFDRQRINNSRTCNVVKRRGNK